MHSAIGQGHSLRIVPTIETALSNVLRRFCLNNITKGTTVACKEPSKDRHSFGKHKHHRQTASIRYVISEEETRAAW